MKLASVHEERKVAPGNLLESIRAEFDRPVPPRNKKLSDFAKGDIDFTTWQEGQIPVPLFVPFNEGYAQSITGLLFDRKRNVKGAHNAKILTPFGRHFQQLVHGKDVLDLGCGHAPDPEVNPVPQHAQTFGASRYIGVDMNQEKETAREEKGFVTAYFEDEMLSFVSKMPDAKNCTKGLFIFMSAIESNHNMSRYEELKDLEDRSLAEGKGLSPKVQGELAVWDAKPEVIEYHYALFRELSRITSQGDAILFGEQTHKIGQAILARYGFQKTGPFWIKQNDGFTAESEPHPLSWIELPDWLHHLLRRK